MANRKARDENITKLRALSEEYKLTVRPDGTLSNYSLFIIVLDLFDPHRHWIFVVTNRYNPIIGTITIAITFTC
jgi:hypothetical protein